MHAHYRNWPNHKLFAPCLPKSGCWRILEHINTDHCSSGAFPYLMNGFKLLFSHNLPKRLMPSLQLGRMHRSIMFTVCGHMYTYSYTHVPKQPLMFKESAEIVSCTRQLFSKVYYNTVETFGL